MVMETPRCIKCRCRLDADGQCECNCEGLDFATVQRISRGNLCGAAGTRNRICAAPRGHVGAHNLVLRTVRED